MFAIVFRFLHLHCQRGVCSCSVTTQYLRAFRLIDSFCKTNISSCRSASSQMNNNLRIRFVVNAVRPLRSRSWIGSVTAPSYIQYRRFAVPTEALDAGKGTIIFPREGPGVSYGLNWALAARGVIVKDNAFHNLTISDLHLKGASPAERLSGLPIYVRGNTSGGVLDMPKPRFSKLLKQVTLHLSSVSNIFVHDGAVGSSPKCDAKVRIISDSASAVLALSNVLWRTSSRAISHDSSTLTVYVATSLSQNIISGVGLETQGHNGFMAADIQCSSLIICGNAFADVDGIKDTLAAVSSSVLLARGGLPLSARLIISGDSVIMVFAAESTIMSCSKLCTFDTGVVLSSHGVAPLFQVRDSSSPNLYKLPSSVIFISIDSSGTLPLVSMLSPGQAAYHFLAGYQDGKFVPSYSEGPSGVDLLELAKGLMLQLQEYSIPAFLLNAGGEKPIIGDKLVKLMETTLLGGISPFEPKGDIGSKYKSFILRKFPELPEEFSF